MVWSATWGEKYENNILLWVHFHAICAKRRIINEYAIAIKDS